MPDGSFVRVVVEESPLLEPAFAARFPEIRTYLVRGVDDAAICGRLDQTPQGFHAILLTASGTIYIDPYWRDDTTTYLAYRKSDFTTNEKLFRCDATEIDGVSAAPRAAPRPTGATLRTYRLAVACTGEYAQAAGGGTLVGTLGAIVTTVNRVNAVYERDLCIRLTFVGNEERIIFLNAATDGYTNTNGDTMLSENQTKLDVAIGNANYDIGHVFSTGGGGVAGLGVVGRTGQKARGVTGLPNPVGDPFDIDFVAHEMGHQFGANHSFNATSGNCAGSKRNASTAYEPGSGTTIMAYAGICSPQDLAPHSDDYFHTVSYAEIDAYTSGTSPGNVGAPTATGNTPPTIAALASYTIPSQTPFALTAVATDPDSNDMLTYCWEEFDLGPAQDPTVMPRDNGTSPLFRSCDPTPNPTRLFPSLNYVLVNSNVPPAIVDGYATGEFLPITSRTMKFRVTVRDNHAGGGGSDNAETTVTSVASAGPFTVTSFNSASTIAAGSTQTITWAVANTSSAPINCANVRISLSTDGGRTFPHVLAASTPNDGVESLSIPSVPGVTTAQGRFKVEAIGNIFFDISNENTTITAPLPQGGLQLVGIGHNFSTARSEFYSIDSTLGAVTVLNVFNWASGAWSPGTFVLSPARDVAFAVDSDNRLYRFSTATGAILSTVLLGKYVQALQVTANNPDRIIAIGYNPTSLHNEFYAIDASSGALSVLNSFDFDSGAWAPPTFVVNPTGEAAFAVDSNNKLYKFSVATGAILSAVSLPRQVQALEVIPATPTGMAGVGYNVSTQHNEFYSINSSSGALTVLNSFDFLSGAWSPFTFVMSPAGDVAYAVDSANTLYRYATVTGTIASMQPLGKGVQAMQVLNDGSTIIGSTGQISPAAGETYAISVNSSTGWAAAASAAWASVSPGSGSNHGIVTVTVAPNPTTSSRGCTITIAGQTHALIQNAAAASTKISPTSHASPAAGETYALAVTANTGWSANSNQTWVAVSPTSGIYNGTVTVTVAVNTTAAIRSAIITIGGAMHLIVQDSPPIAILQQPVGQNAVAGTSATFMVDAAGSGTLAYQWYFMPAAGTTPQPLSDLAGKLTGAHAPTLSISNVQPSDAGDYVCIVTTVGALVTSSAAQLIVVDRLVVISNQTATPGSNVIVPLQLIAHGDENALGFSVNFDATKLTFVSATAGAQATDATLNTNSSQTSSGKLGIAMAKPSGAVWSAGTQEIVKLTFTLASSVPDTTVVPLTFGDVPVAREISSVAAGPLPAGYQSGSVTALSGYEADMNGSGAVTITDWVKVGRIVAGLDPAPTGIDFLKADCAPRSSLGNGALSITDWVQAGRYAAGLDPLTAVGGPAAP